MTAKNAATPIPIDDIIRRDQLVGMCRIFAECFTVRIKLTTMSGQTIVDCYPEAFQSRLAEPDERVSDAHSLTPIIYQNEHVVDVSITHLGNGAEMADPAHLGASVGSVPEPCIPSLATRHIETTLKSSIILAYQSGTSRVKEREQHAVAARVAADELKVANEALETRNAALAANLNRLRELDDLKSQFLATVSHELKTPLTSVMGYSDMLLDGYGGDLNTEQSEYVQIIRERGQTLLEMIDNLLKISVIQRGGASIDLEQCTLETIVEDALATIRPTAINRDIQLDQSIEPGLPDVQIDAQKIRQVVLNLIGNAVKFTPPGGQVTVSLARTRLPGGDQQESHRSANHGIKVSIQDTGKGIERQHLVRIFDAFYQVDNSVTREYGGAGLGLSIAKNFVEAHGGRIEVFSRVGQGSTFSFAIPLTQV
ncbi:MAG: hypothetical protein CMH52_08080 [Myxococcales bacterium]|nr:hypothetical protein [Myxococcales bacterium]